MNKLIQKIPLNNLLLKNKNETRIIKSIGARTKSQIPSNLNIFDRNTKRMQRNSLVCDPNFRDYEYVKSEVGYRVADRIFDIKRTFDSVLDLGCQRGFVSKHLTKETCKKIHMLEMAEKMLEHADLPEEGIQVDKRVFDEENDLPFENESLDLVYSSLK
jgi:NADH dehydrogenase [ubiquinone] 1 alpha subcomplex assembly factor 5